MSEEAQRDFQVPVTQMGHSGKTHAARFFRITRSSVCMEDFANTTKVPTCTPCSYFLIHFKLNVTKENVGSSPALCPLLSPWEPSTNYSPQP